MFDRVRKINMAWEWQHFTVTEMKPTTMQQGRATEIDAFGVNKTRLEHKIMMA
uniref:Uncharacterized protein n=1 Tax=Fagus sylvatica TaxID=28930 RepID=A0A2N9GX67_FAGSY